MNLIATILISSIFSGPLGENENPPNSTEQSAVAGNSVIVKGTWVRNDALSGPNREVGTCERKGKCLTIHMDDLGRIIGVDIYDGPVRTGDNIDITVMDNLYIINF